MSIQTRTNLKANSLTGKIITQDLLDSIIDSALNIADVTAQTISSNIIVPNLAANVVSADSVYATNLFTAGLNTNKNPVIEYSIAATANVSANDNLFHNVDIITSAGLNQNFSLASGKATYIGAVTAYFSISYALSVNEKHPNETANIQIAINGVANHASKMQFKGAQAEKNLTTECIAFLKPSDYFQLQINAVTTAEQWWEFDSLICIAFPVYWG